MILQLNQQPGKNELSSGVDAVALALATELAELRDQLDKRTGQCLEYRALALELDEALKESERRIEELEAELVETLDRCMDKWGETP